MHSTAIDIELPLRVRRLDPAADIIETMVPSRPRADDRLPSARPFPVDLLLAAPAGPYELTVEVTHDDRVVGTWQIDDSLRDRSGTFVSQAKAALHVCASSSDNPRQTGAFLAITHWWVGADSPTQIAELYQALSRDVLDRLVSLLGARPEADARRVFVLHLLDVRRRDRRMLILSVLEAALLRELAARPPLTGLELRVAHGHGTGSAAMLDTTPTSLPATRPMPLESAPTPEPAQSKTVTWWPRRASTGS